MIYTLTLNPAIDYSVRLSENLKIGEENRSFGEKILAGGKGINCAVMLKRLGAEVKALGFCGGITGEKIKNVLVDEGIEQGFTQTASETRINIKISGESITEINSLGGNITEKETEKMWESLSEITKNDILIVSGSIPPGVDESIYGEILKKTFVKNIPAVLDAKGSVLRDCLKYAPLLVKPNITELSEVFGEEITDIKAIAEKAEKLCEMGAKNALVSMGAKGALLCTEKREIYTIPAVPVKAESTVGSGDATVAGFIWAYQNTGDYIKALRLACAAGSATAATVGIAKGEDAEKLFEVTKGTVSKYSFEEA